MKCIGFDINEKEIILTLKEKNNCVKSIKSPTCFSKKEYYENNNCFYILKDNFIYDIKYEYNKDIIKKMMLNWNEKYSYQVLKCIIHSMLKQVSDDGDIIYSNIINDDSYEYACHKQSVKNIFDSYDYNNNKIKIYQIDEGLALIYAELGHKNFNGIGISFSYEVVNICYAIYGQPIIKFYLNRNELSLASIFDKIKYEIERLSIKITASIDVVISDKKNELKNTDLEINFNNFPIIIDSIIIPQDNIYAVSRGCLYAAIDSTK